MSKFATVEIIHVCHSSHREVNSDGSGAQGSTLLFQCYYFLPDVNNSF